MRGEEEQGVWVGRCVKKGGMIERKGRPSQSHDGRWSVREEGGKDVCCYQCCYQPVVLARAAVRCARSPPCRCSRLPDPPTQSHERKRKRKRGGHCPPAPVLALTLVPALALVPVLALAQALALVLVRRGCGRLATEPWSCPSPSHHSPPPSRGDNHHHHQQQQQQKHQ